MKQIITSSLILVAIVSTNAQSLKTFIDKALEENYQIKIVRNEAQISSNNNTLSNAGLSPTIDVSGNFSTSSNNTNQELADGSVRTGTNAQTVSMGASALVNWSVFDGFRVYAKKDQLAYLEQLGKVNADYYIEQTIADITLYYHQLMRAELLMKSYEQNLAISKYRKDLQTKRKEVGAATLLEYEQALIDYRQDSINLLAQKNAVKTLAIDLQRLINGDLESAINVDQQILLEGYQDKDSLMSKLETQNSQFEVERLNKLIAETNVRVERADMFPQVNLFAGYAFSHSLAEVGLITSNRNSGPTIGVQVNFNLYNGGNKLRELRNMEITESNVSLNKQDVELGLRAELLKNYHERQSIMTRIELVMENVSSAEKVTDIARQQLQKGVINGYDFRVTQQSLITAQNNLIELQYAAKVLEINIARLTGDIKNSFL